MLNKEFVELSRFISKNIARVSLVSALTFAGAAAYEQLQPSSASAQEESECTIIVETYNPYVAKDEQLRSTRSIPCSSTYGVEVNINKRSVKYTSPDQYHRETIGIVIAIAAACLGTGLAVAMTSSRN